jgi:MFS family permease
MDKLQPRSRFGAGGALAVTAAAVALLAVTIGTRSVFGLFLSPLNSATGLGVATISFAIAVSQLTWGVAQPFAGILSERIGAARVILAGTLLSAAAGAVLPFAHGAAMLVAVFALGGVAATVGSPSLLIGTVSQRVPPERRGMIAMAVLPPTAGLIGRLYGAQRLATLLGITFLAHQAGAFLGAWLGGVVLESTGSYDLMWRLDLALAAVAAAVSLSVREQPLPAVPTEKRPPLGLRTGPIVTAKM